MKLFGFLLVCTASGEPCSSKLGDVFSVTTSTGFSCENGGVHACFLNPSDSTNWISIATQTAYLVRRIELINGKGQLPNRMRLSANVGASGRAWYGSSAVAAWSTLTPSFADNQTTTFELTKYLQFTNLTIWPTSNNVSGEDGMSFDAAIIGCASNSTRVVDYVFNSSNSAIEQSYSSMSNFEAAILKMVSSKVDSGRLVVNSSVGEGSLTVSIRVLPDPAASLSVDDATNILASDPELMTKLAKLQGVVQDDSSSLCYNKVCRAPSFCLNGNCVDRSGITIQEAPLETSSVYLRPLPPYVQVVQTATTPATVEPDNRNVGAYVIGGLVFATVLGILLGYKWQSI